MYFGESRTAIFINNAISPGRVITFTFRLPIFLLYLSYRRL